MEDSFHSYFVASLQSKLLSLVTELDQPPLTPLHHQAQYISSVIYPITCLPACLTNSQW